MAAPAIGLRALVAPNRWVPVDWSHPLAPVGGWAALPHTGTDAFGNVGTATSNASRNGSTAYGAAMSTSSAVTGGIQFPTPAALTAATAGLTMVSVSNIVGLNAGNSHALLIRDNAADSGAFLVASLSAVNSSGNANFFIRNQSGSFAQFGTPISAGLASGLGSCVHVGVFNAATATGTLYRNGNQVGTGTWSGVTALSWPTASPGIGVLGYGTNTGSQGVQGSCSLALVYPRVLSANEVAAISADPFQIFRQ